MEDHYILLDNASFGNSYSWISMHIDLNFNKLEIDLDSILNGAKTFGNSQNEIVFIHEYVHFLQNFYCSWGGLTFCEFILALEKLGASKVVDNIVFKLPLKIEPIADADLWNKGVFHYDTFCLLIGPEKKPILFENLCPNEKAIIKSISEEELVLNNGRISYCISNKAIREHMADLSSLLFSNSSDESIHNRHINSRVFCSADYVLDKNPMYWMMFEYFYSNRFENIAEALVIICHAALSTASPVRLIIRFFKFFQEVNKSGDQISNLKEIVIWFLNLATENIAFSYSYHEAIKGIVNQINLCSNHYDHDFYRFNSHIFTKLLTSISYFFSAKLFFRAPENLRDKNLWVSLIKQTGTPIIRYKDKTPAITLNDQDLQNSLTYFLGITKLFEYLQDSAKYSCPFHSEFNICNANFRNNENCINDPFLVKNPLKDGSECLFQNALELLGLKDRIKH